MNSNIINKETLRKVQLETMNTLKDALLKSFGPYGSNTIIYSGKDALPRYTKDGHTILNSIQLNGPIESSVHTDIEEETRTQAMKVGDSTTSVTILSALIFEKLAKYEKESTVPPADIVKAFKVVVESIKETIKKHGREATLQDMYDVALISTNGNEDLANELKVVYDAFGLDVYIDVKASLTGTTYTKDINGMVLEYGYMDTTFINNPSNNTCELRNPSIYAFEDPIDTIEMGTYLDMIIEDNILKPAKEKKFDQIIPTIIIAPRMSKDFSAYIDQLIRNFASVEAVARLPFNMITNIESSDFDSYNDICELCGCKYIKKYLDPEIQKRDVEMGLAIDPTNRESLHNMAGSAEMIISDNSKTTFINPALMYEDDNRTVYSEVFNRNLDWLKSEIEKLTIEGNNAVEIYNLKKRLNSLKGNMVEIFVGGITIADRDQARDLMEDAALNCRSAVKSGIGFGANYEGLYACNDLIENEKFENGSIYEEILKLIYDCYFELTTILYGTIKDDEEAKRLVKLSLNIPANGPYNLRTKSFDGKVLSSIDTDIYALDTISKIITIMATSNQFLLPMINANVY